MSAGGDMRLGGGYVELYSKDDMGGGLSSAQSAMQSFAAAFERVGQRMATAGKSLMIVGTAMAAPLAAAVKVGANFEALESKFSTVFGDMAGDADAWANDLSQSLGKSLLAIKGAMSNLQDTFVPLGFAREEATKMSKEVTALSADLAAFNPAVKGIDDASKSLISTLVGNHEAARKFGVIITATALDAKLLDMGFQSVSQGATEQQKVLARLNMIMAGTADAQGAAIGQANNFNAVTERLKASLERIANTVGRVLLPAYKRMAIATVRVADWFGRFLSRNPQLIQSFDKIAGALIGIGASMWGLGKAAEYVSVLMSPVGLWAAAVAGALYFSGALDGMIDKWGEFISNIQIGGKTVGEWFNAIVPVAEKAWTILTLYAQQFAEDIEAVMLRVGDKISDVFFKIAPGVIDAFAGMATGIVKLFNGMIDTIADQLNPLLRKLNWVITTVNGLSGKDIKQFTDFKSNKVGTDKIDNFAQGAKDALAGMQGEIGGASDSRQAELRESYYARKSRIDEAMAGLSSDLQALVGPILEKLFAPFGGMDTPGAPGTPGTGPGAEGGAGRATPGQVFGSFSASASRYGIGPGDNWQKKLQKTGEDQLDRLDRIANNTGSMSASFNYTGGPA